MLVVGGSRSVFGAVLGTLVVGGLNEMLRSLEEGASLFGLISLGETPGMAAIGLGLLLLITMIAMPDGLTGGREAGEWLGRWRRQQQDRIRPAWSERPDRPSDGSLSARGVSVSFGGLQVLNGVDLELSRGEILGLIGPNGAGKTTLVNVLSGFQPPHSGEVTLDGVSVTGWKPERLARLGLGRSFQAGLPFRRLTSLEAVATGAMGVGCRKREATIRASELLERLGLSSHASTPMGSLPPGTQRLLGVARALATEPRYLLLDEPAAGLGDHERADLVERFRPLPLDFDCGLLVIEHDIGLVADLCSEVQVIDDGATIALGTPAAVQSDPAVIESYLGSGFAVVLDA
jgi:branched-chain amino acid transport system permease protein